MKKVILMFLLAVTFAAKISNAQVEVNQSYLSICEGSSATINAIGSVSYFWSPSEGLNSTIGNSVIASPPFSLTYTVTGFDSNGNSSEAMVSVQVNVNPVINLGFVQPSSCNYVEGLYVNPIYQNIKIMQDLVYGQNYLFNNQLQDLKLDVYLPNQLVNYKRAAIIILHGGGFLFGDKSDSTPVALSQYFSERGYVVYDANYRIGMGPLNEANAGKAYYRAIQDAKACVRYIKKTGTDLGVDTSQIFMAGVSAGAVTSIGTAYLDQNEIPSFINYSALGLLDNEGGNTGYSSKVNGVISIAGGVYDTTTIFDNETEPLYSFHGTSDNVIPYYSGLLGGLVLTYGGYSINKAANDAGLNSSLHTFINGPHVPSINSLEMDSIFTESNSFLYSLVKNKHGENSCAMILATGGTQFNWSPATNISNPYSNQLIATPENLTNYNLTVTDSFGCYSHTDLDIKSAHPLYTEIKTDTIGKYLNLFTVSGGGQESLNFMWSNGTTASTLKHVAPGTYAISVTSGNCNMTDEKEIIYPLITKATDLKTEFITSCGVKFKWEPMPHVLYQKVLLTNMDDSIAQHSFLIHGENTFDYSDLIPSTNYKFEVTEYTWNDSTAGPAILYFKSKQCEMPIQLVSNNVGSDNCTIQWEGTCNPESYRFKYRELGTTQWNVSLTGTESMQLNNLASGTSYEYYVRSVCINGSSYSKKSNTEIFTTLGLRTENINHNINSEITVYPNPNNGSFIVQASLSDNIENTEIQIINSLGQIVYRQPVLVEDGTVYESITIRNKIVTGIYELRIKNGNECLKSRIAIR